MQGFRQPCSSFPSLEYLYQLQRSSDETPRRKPRSPPTPSSWRSQDQSGQGILRCKMCFDFKSSTRTACLLYSVSPSMANNSVLGLTRPMFSGTFHRCRQVVLQPPRAFYRSLPMHRQVRRRLSLARWFVSAWKAPGNKETTKEQ
jgi:hypothetical protein